MRPIVPRGKSARLYLVGFVFVLLVLSSLVMTGLGLLFERLGVSFGGRLMDLLYLPAVSVVIGTLVASVLSALVVRPYRQLVEATQRVARGQFDTRVELKGPVEVESLAQSFNAMALELSGIETMRSDFVSSVSHEFKTPIASIMGFAKLLKKDGLSPERRNEYLDTIIRESDRLGQLTSNVLLLSKIEKQQILSDRRAFALDEQLRRALLILAPQWEAKRIELDAELPALRFVGSEQLLMEVWLNLIGNAVKFTPAGGRVRVLMEPRPARVRVTVSDTGIGMDEQTIHHIFDKFYQGDASRGTEGNGLGLPLVARIVKMSGGTITVESEPDKGTCVCVELPSGEEGAIESGQ